MKKNLILLLLCVGLAPQAQGTIFSKGALSTFKDKLKHALEGQCKSAKKNSKLHKACLVGAPIAEFVAAALFLRVMTGVIAGTLNASDAKKLTPLEAFEKGFENPIQTMRHKDLVRRGDSTELRKFRDNLLSEDGEVDYGNFWNGMKNKIKKVKRLAGERLDGVLSCT